MEGGVPEADRTAAPTSGGVYSASGASGTDSASSRQAEGTQLPPQGEPPHMRERLGVLRL